MGMESLRLLLNHSPARTVLTISVEQANLHAHSLLFMRGSALVAESNGVFHACTSSIHPQIHSTGTWVLLQHSKTHLINTTFLNSKNWSFSSHRKQLDSQKSPNHSSIKSTFRSLRLSCLRSFSKPHSHTALQKWIVWLENSLNKTVRIKLSELSWAWLWEMYTQILNYLFIFHSFSSHIVFLLSRQMMADPDS